MSEEELRKALEIMTKPMALEEIRNFKYTFFDNSGDEESFTLEDYLDLSNNVYNLERENQRLKEKLKWKTEVAEISTNSYNKEKEKLALYKEVIDEVREYIESKNNGVCVVNGEEKPAYTFLLDFREAREFVWELLQILDKAKEKENDGI